MLRNNTCVQQWSHIKHDLIFLGLKKNFAASVVSECSKDE